MNDAVDKYTLKETKKEEALTWVWYGSISRKPMISFHTRKS